MFKLSKLRRDQNGSGLLLCIFILFFTICIGGVLVDVSILYKAKGEMRKAANAAVLSGAQIIFEKDESIKNVVSEILTANNEPYDKNNLQINRTENKLTYTLHKTVPLYFMRIFGIDTIPITVTSSAVRELATAMTGVVPLGVEEGIKLEVGKKYILKGKKQEDSPGWFGFLNLDGNKNPHDIADLINNGYSGEIKINQILDKTPGEKASVGKDIVPRIAPIIIYEMIDRGKNDSIKVKGFAYCKITVDDSDKKVFYGEFIKTADVSSISGTINDSLIYKCRLVE